MRPLFVLSCFVVLACVGHASVVVETSPAKPLAELVRNADAVEVEFYSKAEKSVVKFDDVVWRERLASALELGSYSAKAHCLCISYPMIRLYRGKQLIATLSVHHGDKLRAYAKTVSGDFHVGEALGRAVTELATEKKG